MRRVRWMIGAAVILGMLASACSGGNGSNKTATAGAATTPTVRATPNTTAPSGIASPTVPGSADATATAAPTTTGLRACGPSDVSARASEQSAEGAIGGAVTITNTSSSACGISGAVVTLRDSTGKELASSGAAANGSTLAVDAGRSASITFIWTNWCGDAPSGPLSVSVVAGSDPIVTNIAGTSAGAVPVPRCDVQADASKLTVTDVRLLAG